MHTLLRELVIPERAAPVFNALVDHAAVERQALVKARACVCACVDVCVVDCPVRACTCHASCDDGNKCMRSARALPL